MSSWESSAAHRMAVTYGPEVCRLDRAGRIAWAQALIDRLNRAYADEREVHKRECEHCQRHAFCADGWSISKEQRERLDKIVRLEDMVEMEHRDQEYADRARTHRVEHKDHIDGWCSYWQNVIHRRFCAAGWKCEGCGERRKLQGHHCTEGGDLYAHLGFEEIDDLQALCGQCHEKAPRW